MGKAVIVSELGEGLYTIRKEVAGLEQARALIAEQRAKLEEELPILRAEEEAAKIETAYRRFLADSLVDDWASGIDIPEESLSFDFGYTFDEQAQAYVNEGIQGKVTGFEVPEAVLNAIHTLVEARMLQDDITRRLNEKSAQYLALLKRQSELTALNNSVQTPISAWCADYTEELTGEVATLEVPGEVDPTIGGGLNIKPGYDDDAVWASAYGEIQMGSVISPAAFAWNLTMLTPWMKWMPLWRYATVDSVDKDNDTVNVTLVPILSKVGAYLRKDLTLNAPWESKMTGVPVEYMDCNAEVFEVGDEVLLQFSAIPGSDPPDYAPVCIGFKTNPIVCNALYLSGIHEIASFNSVMGEYAGQFFPSRETARGIERKWYTYGNMPDFLWPPHNTDSETATEEEKFVIEWVVPSMPPIPDDTAGGYAPYPSMYTGKMRLVQQKKYGYLRTNLFMDNINCGIFIPEIDNILHVNRQRWVIDVLNDGRVLAYKIDFVNELTGANQNFLDTFAGLSQNEQDRYDYGIKKSFSIPSMFVPFSEWNEGLEDTGILLLPAGGPVSTALEGKSPMTNWHSLWSFSYDGHEAQAVVVGEDAYDGGVLWRSYRYKLDISQNGQGVPNTAEITLVESDYLWTTQSEPAPLQDHPLAAPVDSAFSEFIYYWRPDQATGGTWPDEHDAPVYAFYNKENELVVLRHKFIKETSLLDEVVDEPTDYFGIIVSGGPPDVSCYKERVGGTAKLWDREWYTYDQRIRGMNCYYIQSSDLIDPEYYSQYRVAALEKWSRGSFTSSGEESLGICGTGSVIVFREVYAGRREVPEFPYTVINNFYHQVGIPAFNREALFYFSRKSEQIPSHNIFVSTAPGGLGPMYYLSGWRTEGGIKVPGSDFTPGGDGSAGSGASGGSLTGVPALETNEDNYYFFSSFHERKDLITPDNPTFWFAQKYQIYSADIGSFSGVGAILPWPRTDGFDEKIDLISINNANQFIEPGSNDDIDYPINEASQYVAGPLSYPLIVFIGDDSTIDKGLMPDITTDLEAIKVKNT